MGELRSNRSAVISFLGFGLFEHTSERQAVVCRGWGFAGKEWGVQRKYATKIRTGVLSCGTAFSIRSEQWS